MPVALSRYNVALFAFAALCVLCAVFIYRFEQSSLLMMILGIPIPLMAGSFPRKYALAALFIVCLTALTVFILQPVSAMQQFLLMLVLVASSWAIVLHMYNSYIPKNDLPFLQQAVTNNISNLEMVVNNQGKLILISPACIELTGFRPEEFLAQPTLLMQVVPIEDMHKILGFLDGNLPPASLIQIRFLTRDGYTSTTLNGICRTLRDKKGRNVGRFLSCVKDDSTLSDNWSSSFSERKNRQIAELTESMEEVFWSQKTDKTSFEYVSSSAISLLGYKAEALSANSNMLYDIIHAEDVANVRIAFSDLTRDGIEMKEEFRVLLPDGQIRWILAKGYCIEEHNGSILRVGGFFKNIEERKIKEQNLTNQSNLYHDLIEKQAGGISIIDMQGNFTYMNAFGTELLRIDPAALTMMNKKAFLTEEGVRLVAKYDAIMYAGQTAAFELPIVLPTSEERILYIIGKPHYDNKGRQDGVIETFYDITEYKEKQRALEYQTYHDSLTGLLNRTSYEDFLHNHKADAGASVGVVMVDVNGLKSVNDQLGHNQGDLLLQKSAKILKDSVRSNDLVARIGGDEFILLMPETNQGAINQVMARIETKCEEFNQTAGAAFVISLALGGYITSGDKTLAEAIREADMRMYRAKNGLHRR